VRGRVLDAGCGAGRVALHLQERGSEVVAIDISPGAIEVCRRRGVRDARLLDLAALADSSDLGVFDTVVLFGNNFGMFENAKRASTLLRRLRRVCAERSRIIAGTVDPYDTDEPVHLEYHARNRQRRRMAGQVRMRVRHRDFATPWFDWLFVSRGELQDIASGAGWQFVRSIPEKGAAYVAILEPAA
jgi:SAM-dependent methyltransferase